MLVDRPVDTHLGLKSVGSSPPWHIRVCLRVGGRHPPHRCNSSRSRALALPLSHGSSFYWLSQVPGCCLARMLELFPDATVRSRQLSKYSCLILHTALVSTDKDNDSVSTALDGKLSCQVWSVPIIHSCKLLFKKREVTFLSRFFSIGKKGHPKDTLTNKGMLWENPDTSP